MTCIVAHRDGWMVADRRMTFQDSLIGPYVVNKIQRGTGLLVATSGCGSLNDRVARVLREEHSQDALRAIQDVFLGSDGRPGHALVLHGQRIFEITSRGSLVELADQAAYWAIGSGYQVALGYLRACSARCSRVVVAHAISAIDCASTLVNDVGDGHQVEHI